MSVVLFFKNLWKKNVLPKEKTDTRTQIAPTISINLKEQIERLAYVIDQPIQNLCVHLFVEGVNQYEVINHISPYFQTGVLIMEPTLFFGNTVHKKVPATTKGETDRIHIRFNDYDMQDVELMARLLDVTPTHAVAVLLDASIRHIQIVETLLMKHNRRMAFDEITVNELKKLMRYINNRNPYKAEWNKYLLTVVDGPKKRNVIQGMLLTEKMIDHETYRWNFD